MPRFLGDDDRLHLLEVVGWLVDRGALGVDAFRLMPNHYQLLLSTPGGPWHDGCGTSTETTGGGSTTPVPSGRAPVAGTVQSDPGG